MAVTSNPDGSLSAGETPAAHVGDDIRALRKSRSLTLAALSAQLGRSTGWLSQVERGVTEPAIQDLREVAGFFKIPISFFFRNDRAPERERGLIVRKVARATLGAAEHGLTEQLLSPDLSGDFEMIRSVFEPGASRREVPARPTQEGGYLISGRLNIWIAGQKFMLESGDSFGFTNHSYRWENPGTEPAIVVWIVSPPVY